MRFAFVLHVGDFGVWPDPARVDAATKRHDDAGDFPAWFAERREAASAGGTSSASGHRARERVRVPSCTTEVPDAVRLAGVVVGSAVAAAALCVPSVELFGLQECAA